MGYDDDRIENFLYYKSWAVDDLQDQQPKQVVYYLTTKNNIFMV